MTMLYVPKRKIDQVGTIVGWILTAAMCYPRPAVAIRVNHDWQSCLPFGCVHGLSNFSDSGREVGMPQLLTFYVDYQEL